VTWYRFSNRMFAFRFANLQRRGLVAEACGVVAAGVLLGGLGNWLSPRGLSLFRDYFPVLATVPGTAASGSVPAGDPAAARLQERGFQTLTGDDMLALFRDPGRALERVIFIDARADEHYQGGHIPGAFQLDPFRAEVHLGGVVAVCRTAEKIAVYCTGGECEDSERAVALLVQAGVPRERLFVSPGGMAAWSAAGNPVETGPRLSGMMQPSARP
jgi:rhodanese-related sulfurtransferase